MKGIIFKNTEIESENMNTGNVLYLSLHSQNIEHKHGS